MMNQASEPELTDGSTLSEEAEVAEERSDPKLVPVSEAIRYRKRAQTAEVTVGELERQLATVESDLRETANRMEMLERVQEIDHALLEAEVVDLDSARLLVGEALADDDTEMNGVVGAVEEIRERKPHLFRIEAAVAGGAVEGGDGSGGGVMGGAVRVRDRSGPRPALTAAARALASGRRQDVLRYMRLRRAGA